jgi:hypothetical protein
MRFSCPGGLSQRNSPAGWTRRRPDWTARRAVGPDVAICADLVDPGRVNSVNSFERWESQAALETFRSSGPDTEQRPAMLTVSVQECDIADVRPVFGKGAG